MMLETSDVTLSALDVAPRPGAAPGSYVRLRVVDTGTGIAASRPRAHLRAVLHDEGRPARAPGSARHLLRHRRAERRLHDGDERGRPREPRSRCSCRPSTADGSRRPSAISLSTIFAADSASDSRSVRTSTAGAVGASYGSLHAGEVGDLAGLRLLVEAFDVALRDGRERRVDEHLDERDGPHPPTASRAPRASSRYGEIAADEHEHAVLREQARDVGDAVDVGVAVLRARSRGPWTGRARISSPSSSSTATPRRELRGRPRSRASTCRPRRAR